MTTTEKLNKFVQSVYLVRYGRYIDDITDDDGVIEVAKTIDWTNQFLEELEEEADWQYLRENNYNLGVVATASQIFELPDEVRKLVVDENRPLTIYQGDTLVSKWDVVNPNQLTERSDNGYRENRVTFVNNQVVFSRPLDEGEIGGVVEADVINYMPELSDTNVDLLDLIKPKQLLILGVAKNATLPDIVQGGLSPSFAQKYSDLLDKAIMENEKTATASSTVGDDYSYITGVY